MHVASSIFGAALLAVASAEVCVNVRTRTTMTEVVVTKTLEVTEVAACPTPTDDDDDDIANLFPTEWPSDLIPTFKPTIPLDPVPVPSVPASSKPPVVTTLTTTSVVTECPAVETDCVVGVTSTITITTTTDCDDDEPTGLPSASLPNTEGPASSGEPSSPATDSPATSVDPAVPSDGTTLAPEATPTSECDEDESSSTADSEHGTSEAPAASSTECDDEDIPTSTPAASSPSEEESSSPEPTSTECDDETTSPAPVPTGDDESSAPAPSSTSCDDDELSTPAPTPTPSQDDESSPEPSSTSCTDETTAEETPEATAETPETTEAVIPETTAAEIPATTEAAPTTLSTVTLPPEEPTSSIEEEEPEPTTLRAYPADIVDKLQDESMEKLKRYLAANPPTNGCTLEKATVRREWGDLSVDQRKEYIGAVKCLQQLPAKSNTRDVPGARSRFDDFVYTHVSQTNSIHNTANFLSWHRYYIHAYEKALRDECGYTGAHPYWNWDRYAADPASSPLFNGDDASLGGGCGMPGPFADMVVHLGPGSAVRYNPRCLSREVNKQWARMTTVAYSHPLIVESGSISTFQDRLQASPGVHAGGHNTFGGDPGKYIHSSSGDPAFYLHHAGVDRLWWIWQLQNLEDRLEAVDGRVVGSRATGSLNDPIHLGVNGARKTIRDMMNTMDGDLCYIYY